MAFGNEELDVDRVAIEYVGWALNLDSAVGSEQTP